MTGRHPSTEPPSPAEIYDIGATFHMDLSDEEVSDYLDLTHEGLDTYAALERLTEDERKWRQEGTDRGPGSKPGETEDPLNAFVTNCSVSSTNSGPLDGLTIGLKDNIAVAGVEMTCGSRVMSEYVPETDATIVRRILEAGGTITGKTNMDSWAVSGTGALTATGPIRNPRNPDYLAGGSSGGSAAAVVSGDVDIAWGTDQAGSVRIPAAWCGCVGLKPTYGLVPYTGVVANGYVTDHVGPLATSVADCARVLDVTAGDDGLDPRLGPGTIPVGDYEAALETKPSGLTIGVLSEGFGRGEGEVDDVVYEALARFETTQEMISVTDVSIPWHAHGILIWSVMTGINTTAAVRDEGSCRYLKGHYDMQYLRAYADRRRSRADDFPPTLKASIIAGQFAHDRYHGYYHAKAQNCNRVLTKKYDEMLESVDVLAMPTTPVLPSEVQTEYESRTELVRSVRGRDGLVANTSPFNVTGHPAISVPAGTVSGLPVGLMFVGSRFDDETVLRVGHTFEQHVESTNQPS